MIPDTAILSSDEPLQEFTVSPSLTYRLDNQNNRVIGKVDNVSSVSQALLKIFSTSKYDYPIYDQYYGNELNSLIGKPYSYAEVEAERIVRESVMTDDRVTGITNFNISRYNVDSFSITVTVNTVYGDASLEIEVAS